MSVGKRILLSLPLLVCLLLLEASAMDSLIDAGQTLAYAIAAPTSLGLPLIVLISAWIVRGMK